MSDRHDLITSWWRGLSLRAKVTGVTVALLAVGLFAAGGGTMAFLRNTLIQNVDTNVRQVATSEIATSFLTTVVVDGIVTFSPRDSAAPTDYFIAVYTPDGERQVFVQPSDAQTAPPVPRTFALANALEADAATFTLTDAETGETFKAAVGPFQIQGASGVYTQLVAISLAPTERVVATFIGIYSILALLILVVSAAVTRYLVTLTFRGLGQVEATAMSIAAGDFTQRMADVVPGTEVGRLKGAINTMLGRVDAALRQRDATVRQMRRFIGDASHELRTPLVTVRGYAELYRMGAIRSEEDVAQSMERIEKEAIRMGVLVEDLLALARLDERRDAEITPIDLRPLARDAALDLRAASPQRSVTVDDTSEPPAAPAPPPAELPTPEPPRPASPAENVGPREPVEGKATGDGRRRTSPATSAIAIAGATISRLRRRQRAEGVESDAASPPGTEIVAPIVLGEENRIRQVIANLLGNARRFTADTSPIDLRVGTDVVAGMGWIEVIDHGEGIPEQIRDQIFQRFWRADTSRTRETGGAGLGLSIVASIVDTLRGAVTVTDTPGGGATFRVSLPLASTADPRTVDHPAPAESAAPDEDFSFAASG